jgi:Homing endonuclease associated repeat
MNKPIFQLSRVSGQPISDAELLADLQRVALLLPVTNFVTNEKYTEHGKFDPTTISRRFGTWNKGLLAAGLSLSNEFYSDEQLFENLLVLWQHYGRQPRKRELSNKPSAISEGPYKRRFGGWIAALTVFVDYANSSEREVVQKIAAGSVSQHITSREPSLRLRWKVLHRDRFLVTIVAEVLQKRRTWSFAWIIFYLGVRAEKPCSIIFRRFVTIVILANQTNAKPINKI